MNYEYLTVVTLRVWKVDFTNKVFVIRQYDVYGSLARHIMEYSHRFKPMKHEGRVCLLPQ